MTIDPRWGFYLSILLAVIGALAGASTQLTTIFGEHTATIILACAVLLLTVGNAINAVLHAIPSKPGAANEFPLGPKVIMAGFMLLPFLLIGQARAADVATKAPAISYQYPTTKCGLYYGANTMGTSSAVENSAVGTQVVQGAVGVTIGYTCPAGAGFWFVDGMFDFANFNGSSNGLSVGGPASLEERFGFGVPANLLISLIPGLQQLQNAVPGIIPLPTGVTVNTSSPYMYVGLHEDDVSATLGLSTAKEWLFSTGLGMGNKVRLSNGVVFDPFAEYIIPSSRLCLGPVGVAGGCLKQGAGVRVGAAIEF